MVRQSVTAFFDGESDPRFPVRCTGVEIVEAEERRRSRCTVDLRTDAGATFRATFRIDHVGGNVYDVVGRLEDGDPRTFTCCLPDRAEIPAAPRLSQAIGRFLVEEAGRLVGRSPGTKEPLPPSERRAEESPSPPPVPRASVPSRSARSSGPDRL